MNGLVLIDKPAGWTSHDAVNRWRRLAATKRAGHLGTLDPMATGLLALVTGTATRLAQFFGDNHKTYQAEILLGVVSDSYDMEGEVESTGIAPPKDASVVLAALETFRGAFLQMPPPVSAKKIGGVPAYKLARKNLPVDLQPVPIDVTRLEVLQTPLPKLEILLTVTAGGYIRSIAHDLGQKLGCGAVLSGLRRLASGAYSVGQARTLEALGDLAGQGRLQEAIIPAGELLPHFPSEYVDDSVVAQIRQGRDFRTSPFVVSPGAPYVKALSRSGELIAIGSMKMPNVYHPGTVL